MYGIVNSMMFMKKVLEIRDYKQHKLSLHNDRNGYWVAIVPPCRLGRTCTNYHKDLKSAYRDAESVIDKLLIK